MSGVGQAPSWLAAPPGAGWGSDDATGAEENPFVRWRSLLWSHHRALAAGWTDADFVALVRSLDDAVASVDGVGFRITPYRSEPALAEAIGVAHLGVKDETGNVAGSHKARHLFGLLLHFAVDAVAKDAPLAISSCGNAALGAATVARAAGRPLEVFIPTWADPVVVARLRELGAVITVCERRPGDDGDPCMARLSEAVAAGAVAFSVQGTVNRWTLDGGRTLGFELAAQWAEAAAAPVDQLYVQVGGGALLASVAAGLLDAAAVGGPCAVPAVFAVQAEGAAPLDRAWRRWMAQPGALDEREAYALAHPEEFMWPWTPEPTSVATGILDDVTYDWLGVMRALELTGGDSVVAPEATVLEANVLARAHTAVPADATGTAGLAGLLHARRTARAGSSTAAAVLFTGRARAQG